MSAVNFRKVAIVGAGAIGGWMGVHLARAGAQVSVLARGDTLQALQKNGLQMHQGGELHTVLVVASQDAAALGVQDLVVISVKAPALASVAAGAVAALCVLPAPGLQRQCQPPGRPASRHPSRLTCGKSRRGHPAA